MYRQTDVQTQEMLYAFHYDGGIKTYTKPLPVYLVGKWWSRNVIRPQMSLVDPFLHLFILIPTYLNFKMLNLSNDTPKLLLTSWEFYFSWCQSLQ